MKLLSQTFLGGIPEPYNVAFCGINTGIWIQRKLQDSNCLNVLGIYSYLSPIFRARGGELSKAEEDPFLDWF